ncbi:MAG: iron-sulfur cluster assembly accessory protein [Bacteroidetes bacterium]|nr:MAG: iron-sulfur cluster assembly accessory protein [Bacteroidota bacterium]
MNLPIKLTQTAHDEVKKLLQIKGLGNEVGLRVGIRGSGCSGTEFMIGFDKFTEGDVQFSHFDFPIFIQKKHFLYLSGVTVDFIEETTKRGFVFQ